MSPRPDGHGSGDREAFLRRVEKMLAAGRITEEEAARVRAEATEGGGGAGASVIAIRLRHAREWLERQVAGGHMTQEEADEALDRLGRGEDPSVIRQVRRRGSS